MYDEQSLPSPQDDQELKMAIERFEEMIKRNKRYYFDAEVFLNIINHYDERNETAKAIHAADVAIEQFPFSGELLIRKATLLTDDERYEAALKLVSKAENIDPYDANLILLKSDILTLQNKFQQAVDVLNIGLNHSIETHDVLHLEIADVYFEWNKLDQAFDHVKASLEISPQNEFALNRIWYLTEVTERFEDSLELHSKILEEYPFCYTAWCNLSQAYTGLGLYEKALESCSYAIAINENIDTAHRDTGEIYIMLKQYAKAIESLSFVASLNVPDAFVYFNIGYCYEKLKEYETARGFYNRNIQINRNFGEAYYRIAESYSKSNEWTKAIPYYKTALKVNENYLPYYNRYAEALLNGGKIKEANKVYTDLISYNPNKKKWWMNYILTFLLLEKSEDAVFSLNQSLSYMGPLPELCFINAALCYNQGKTKECIMLLIDLLKSDYKKHKILYTYAPDMKKDEVIQDLIKSFKPAR